MSNVETIFIVHPDLREEAVQSVVAASTGLVRSTGGEVLSLDDWGNKKLAYPIEKITRGRYFHMIYKSGEATIDELERNFRLSDRVYRYLTVAVDDEAAAAAVAAASESEALAASEGAEPDFGSGGIEHLLREPSEAVEEDEEDEDSSDDRDGGRGDSSDDSDDDDRKRAPARASSSDDDAEKSTDDDASDKGGE